MPANAANLSQRDAIALTERLLAERFPDADFAFVAGCVMRGAATPSSDIDLVVIHARLPHAHRQSLLFGGVPFEAFVHDPATLRWFFAADVRAGRPVLMRLLSRKVSPSVLARTRLKGCGRRRRRFWKKGRRCWIRRRSIGCAMSSPTC